MSKLYECDKCGDIIREENTYHISLYAYNVAGQGRHDEADLCGSCYMELSEFTRKEDEVERDN